MKEAQVAKCRDWINQCIEVLRQEHIWDSHIQGEINVIPKGEVSALQYISKGNVRNSKSGHYLAKIQSGQKEVSITWVKSVFAKKYLKYVQSHAGTWHDVPQGQFRSASVPHSGTLDWSPPMKNYPQMWFKQESGCDVCAYASISSALHYSGDKDTARSLKEYVGKGYGNISTQQDRDNFKLALSSPKKYNTLTKHRKMGIEDFQRGVVISALLVGSDGSRNHRVAIYNDWIFDSNCDSAVPINTRQFKLVCGWI